MSNSPTADRVISLEVDSPVTLYPDGHAPTLLTADESNAADLVAKAQDALRAFYGSLDKPQRARLDALYGTARVGTGALGQIIDATKARVSQQLASLSAREVNVDDVRIHTARVAHPSLSEPLWAWLSRGTPIQLASPRLTRDANEFVDNSWLTLGGEVFAKQDGSPVTVDEIIGLGRQLDIGQTIARQCEAWAAQRVNAAMIRRESNANFEIALLDALKVGRISTEHYQQLQVSAGLSLAGVFSHGLSVDGQSMHKGNFMLRVQAHDLPAFALKAASDDVIYAATFPEGRLFLPDASVGRTAMQVFTQAFRQDLWDTVHNRAGWSWSLLTPSAQLAVSARIPQRLPHSARYPSTAYWAPDAGVYASKADYERATSDVHFTAPFPLSRSSVVDRLAGVYAALLVGRVKDHFTPNQASSLEHTKRIGLEMLAFVLDTVLIAVPGNVKFPGRALLFKAMFAKQLAIDLPLSLVQSKWDEAAEVMVDFFETVLEMQAGRKAGRLMKSRIDTLNQALLPGRAAGAHVPVSALQRLRSMLPPALRGLDDASLSAMLHQAGIGKPALDAMWQGKTEMDMGLAASAAQTISRALVARTALLLRTPGYTQLPVAVEWPVVGCLARRLDIRISIEDAEGTSIKVFEPETRGQATRDVVLIRHGDWHYGMAEENRDGAMADSLFHFVQLPPASSEAIDNRGAVATALRREVAEQFQHPAGEYLLERAIHHGTRPRAVVPAGEGALLAVSVDGSDSVPEGALQGAAARAISAQCERCVARPGSQANLAKARYQADLAALAGGPGSSGYQSLTHDAQTLYLSGMLGLLKEKGLGQAVAIRIRSGHTSLEAWGDEQAPQVLVLERRGNDGVYTYRGVFNDGDDVLPAADSRMPLSDILLRVMSDTARASLGINIGDAQALNRAVMEKVLADAGRSAALGSLKGVDLLADPELDACQQALTLFEEPGSDGTIVQGGKAWLPWRGGVLEVHQEGPSWRVQGPGTARGPLLHRSYGEWRRLQEPLDVVARLVDGPVAGVAVLARLMAMHVRNPRARIYHDTADTTGGGASYIAFRGLSTTFYRIKPAEAAAQEVELVRPAGTGGGVWLHRLPSGIWGPARTLPGGMNNPDELPWRPWIRPGAQQIPRTLGLEGSVHEATFSLAGGTHKAANRFYPFVRPHRRRTEFDRLFSRAPQDIQRGSDSANIAAKVELFHNQWHLPVDITALRFFRMPGEITSEAKQINGALIADLVLARHAGQPLITRVLEPMSGSGFYSSFVRAAGFRGEVKVNDINPLVSLAQVEIVRQPDRVKHHVNAIKQALVELWQVDNVDCAFDPQTLKIQFPNGAASREFVNSAPVRRFRDDVRHYFYSTVETQYRLIDGGIVIAPDSSFLVDPVNGEAEARAYIAAAFYIMQNNSARHRAPVQVNEMGRLDLPMAIVVRDGNTGSVLLLSSGLSNLDGLNYLSYLHGHERGRTTFSRADGWEMFRVIEGESNLGDLAILSGHFSDVYLDEVQFMRQVEAHVMPFVHNHGRVIITNAYSPYKERAFLALGLRVFVLENRSNGFLLVMNDAVTRDAGLANA